MPTGYTEKIQEGISFDDFIMRCARAFGACITMREAPNNAKIPEEFKPSNYYKKARDKAKIELALYENLTIDQAEERAKKSYIAELQQNLEYILKKEDMKQKYEAMLEKVKNWTPPTPEHTDLKVFMIQQITDSIKFDCGDYYFQHPPILESGKKYKQSRIEMCKKDIKYYSEEYIKEVDRTNKRNKWIKELRNSIKQEKEN